jgi:hypothetical protein
VPKSNARCVEWKSASFELETHIGIQPQTHTHTPTQQKTFWSLFVPTLGEATTTTTTYSPTKTSFNLQMRVCMGTNNSILGLHNNHAQIKRSIERGCCWFKGNLKFITKIDGFLSFIPHWMLMYFFWCLKSHLVYDQTLGFWCCVFLTLWTTLLWIGLQVLHLGFVLQMRKKDNHHTIGSSWSPLQNYIFPPICLAPNESEKNQCFHVHQEQHI